MNTNETDMHVIYVVRSPSDNPAQPLSQGIVNFDDYRDRQNFAERCRQWLADGYSVTTTKVIK